jgi:hypothetical protein
MKMSSLPDLLLSRALTEFLQIPSYLPLVMMMMLLVMKKMKWRS